MSPSTWVHKHPGATVAIVVALLSLCGSSTLPIADTDMLGNENVLQILGVILAGQLAVLALTVPALFEAKASIVETDCPDDLINQSDIIAGELRSNTFWSFLMFGITFLLSLLFEARPDLLDVDLPLLFNVRMLYSAIKVAFVLLSGMAMWDSTEPLFKLSEALTVLKRYAATSRSDETAKLHGRHVKGR